MFEFSFYDKRYHTLDYYYKNKYGYKVFKVNLNLGLSCPNIDGVKGFGGCIYCKSGGSAFGGDKSKNLKTQFELGKEILHKKWKNAKYIAYFGSNSNTYGEISFLKKSFEEVLNYPNVVGINIATRPDAISEDCFLYLKELNKKTDLVIELGLQTIHEKTSILINRGHTLKEFEDMILKLRGAGIKVMVHIINGLPYESQDMMIDTVKYLNKIGLDGIKIHMLHILNNTRLSTLYKKEKFHVLTLEEYVDVVCDQLENLDSKVVVNRLTGDPDPNDLIEPLWVTKKFNVLNEIDKEFKRRGTFQGFNLSILNRARLLMKNHLGQKDLVIDATVGNGKDSLFLLNNIPNGYLFGFDIQKEAISRSNELLSENFDNYTLYNVGHENIGSVLSEYKGKISLIVFNLGYLPRGDKSITTNYDTTIKAIKDSFYLLNDKGHIVVTVYPGHDSGALEDVKIKEFLNLSFEYCFEEYHNTDNKNAPYVIDIKKSNLEK